MIIGYLIIIITTNIEKSKEKGIRILLSDYNLPRVRKISLPWRAGSPRRTA